MRTRDNPTERRALADLSAQLAELQTMTVGQLRDKYREVFGEPSRSRNKGYLRKKVAWRIQERAEGGLSDRAQTKIEQLVQGASVRWPRAKPAQREPKRPKRDPRLPPAGTELRRVYRGVEYTVTVLDRGFDYQGAKYRSLSAIAREITGTRWNGFLFFRVATRSSAEESAE